MNQQRTATGGLIDDPKPFDTLETWERHLADLTKLPDGWLGKAEAIEHAEQHIKMMKQFGFRG
jgi:hypothetical protein